MMKRVLICALLTLFTTTTVHADSRSAGRKVAQDLNFSADELAQVKQAIISNVSHAGGNCSDWSVNMAIGLGDQLPSMSDDAQSHLQTYIYELCKENS